MALSWDCPSAAGATNRMQGAPGQAGGIAWPCTRMLEAEPGSPAALWLLPFCFQSSGYADLPAGPFVCDVASWCCVLGGRD